MKRLSAYLLLVLGLAACSNAQLSERAKARDQLMNLQYADAEKTLTATKILDDDKNRLLTLMELGTVAHYEGNFAKSNIYFFKAKEVFRQLYTSSIREQIAAGILNDNSLSYTGMEYEISLIHYYTTSNFLELSLATKLEAWKQEALLVDGKPIMPAMGEDAKTLSENERQTYLGQARSELLAWDAYLGEVREANHGEPYYKDDLLNKVYAAYIHRLVGTSQDRNIADSLYRDASDVLVRAYCAYPTFNDDWKDFVDNYKKFEEIGLDAVKARFIHPTANYNTTDAQIKTSSKKNTDVMILVENGELPKRVEKRFVIGLTTLFGQIQDPKLRRSVEELGTRAILEMAPAFGLTVVSAALVGAVTDSGKPQYISQAVDSAIGFEFKLPNIENYPATENEELRFRPDGNGAPITLPVAVLSPLGDIAKLNVEKRADAVAFKTGVRVGLKYLTALLPAILTYRKMQGKPDFVRMLVASAMWMGAKKAVDASEAADLRAWDYLPRWIGTVETTLAPGNYGMALVRHEGGKEKEIPLGSVVVTNEKAFHKVRIFSNNKVVYQ